MSLESERARALLLFRTVCYFTKKLMIVSFWNFPFNIYKLWGILCECNADSEPSDEMGQSYMRTENLGLTKTHIEYAAYLLLGIKCRGH